MYPQLAIYSALIASFVAYTGLVYTIGTEDSKLTPEASAAIIAGQKVFKSYNCTACHQIYGLGGHLGPDLTNVASTKGDQYIEIILKTGLGAMPNFTLSAGEIRDLINFFKALDATGQSPLRNFRRTGWGSIELPG